jgi:moderate conductance mechanosensitive channel
MFDNTPDIVLVIASHALAIVLIVIGCALIIKIVMGTIRRILRKMQARAESEASLDETAEIAKRFATILALAGYVIQGFVVIIGGLLVLEELGLNVGPAIAGLGVVGIALAFGSQAIVRDFFSGILILFENQYGQGDVVDIAGASGVVEELTLRRTVLRDSDGVVHNVPNGEIKVASNRTRIWRRINYDVLIAYGTDIDQAIRIFDGVGAELAADPAWSEQILEKPAVDRVEQLGERGITLKILGRVRAPSMVAVTGELRKRILVAMTANSIQIPPAGSTASSPPGASMMAFGPFSDSSPAESIPNPEPPTADPPA